MFEEKSKSYKDNFNNNIFNNTSPGSVFYKGEKESNKRYKNVINNFEIATNICLNSVNINDNSKEPLNYGTKGFTKGSNIYIANGVSNRDEIFAHELVHYLQNILGNVDNGYKINGEWVNYDERLEEQANEAAKELTVSPENLNIEKIRRILGIGKDGVNVSKSVSKIMNGPIQFWGVGGFDSQIMALIKGNAIGVLEGEHEAILRTAIEEVNKQSGDEDVYSTFDVENLKKGCNLNDNYSQNHIYFLIKYILKNDEYINQSQEGSLVMIHSMGPQGELLENKAKINEWFKLCLDVYYNAAVDEDKNFQDITLLEYIKLNQDNQILLEMFLPLMLSKEAVDDLKFSLAVGDDCYYEASNDRQRTEILTNAMFEVIKQINFNASDDRLSKYAGMTIREFFSGGDINDELDDRAISMRAIGSLLHLVHDSMANAHSQRAYDSRVAECKKAETDFKDYNKVLESLSPIVNIQDSKRQVNHNYGDYFCLSKDGGLAIQERIDNTNGARQAQLVTKSILYILSKGEDKEDILNFLDKTTKLDENTEIIEDIKRVKEGDFTLKDKVEYINRLKNGTQLSDIDFLNKDISLTAGGRGYDDYEIGCDEPLESDVREIGKVYMNNVRDNEVRNDIKGLELRLRLYEEQLNMLETIAKLSVNSKTKDGVRNHVVEILLNVLNIIKISNNKEVSKIRNKCVEIINNFT